MSCHALSWHTHPPSPPPPLSSCPFQCHLPCLRSVIDHFRYDREIVSIGMNYFDRYLVLIEASKSAASPSGASSGAPSDGAGGGWRGSAVDGHTYQLAAMTALYIAIKLHADHVDQIEPTVGAGGTASRRRPAQGGGYAGEQHQQQHQHPHSLSHHHHASHTFPAPPVPPLAPRKLRLSAFVELSRGQFSASDITSMEQEMLRVLEWRVHPASSMSFVGHFLRILPPLDGGGAGADDASNSSHPVGPGTGPASIPSSGSRYMLALSQRHGQDPPQTAPSVPSAIVTPTASYDASDWDHSTSPWLGAAEAEAAAERHRALVLHVLHELSRYLAELSICLPDVAAQCPPGTVAYASVLLSLTLLTEDGRAVPTSVREEYLERIEVLSGGELTGNSPAVTALTEQMHRTFVPDMLADAALCAGEGRAEGHPLAIAREHGLLAPDVERRIGGADAGPEEVEEGGLYHDHARGDSPMRDVLDAPRTAPAAGSSGIGSVSGGADEDEDGDGDGGFGRDATQQDCDVRRDDLQRSFTSVIEEAALLGRKMSSFQIDCTGRVAAGLHAADSSSSSSSSRRGGKNKKGHARDDSCSSFVSDTSESPVSVIEALGLVSHPAGGTMPGVSGKPPTPSRHHQSQSVQ